MQIRWRAKEIYLIIYTLRNEINCTGDENDDIDWRKNTYSTFAYIFWTSPPLTAPPVRPSHLG